MSKLQLYLVYPPSVWRGGPESLWLGRFHPLYLWVRASTMMFYVYYVSTRWSGTLQYLVGRFERKLPLVEPLVDAQKWEPTCLGSTWFSSRSTRRPVYEVFSLTEKRKHAKLLPSQVGRIGQTPTYRILQMPAIFPCVLFYFQPFPTFSNTLFQFCARCLYKVSKSMWGHHNILSVESTTLVPLFNDASKSNPQRQRFCRFRWLWRLCQGRERLCGPIQQARRWREMTPLQRSRLTETTTLVELCRICCQVQLVQGEHLAATLPGIFCPYLERFQQA